MMKKLIFIMNLKWYDKQITDSLNRNQWNLTDSIVIESDRSGVDPLT